MEDMRPGRIFFPRQSPSSLILLSISAGADSLGGAKFFVVPP
jgi:hypothetical protein